MGIILILIVVAAILGAIIYSCEGIMPDWLLGLTIVLCGILILFILIGSLVGFTNWANYDEFCYSIPLERETLQKAYDQDGLNSLLISRIVNFNANVKWARNHNNFWFKWVFMEPQYLTVDLIK